jgi:hypothetical protein
MTGKARIDVFEKLGSEIRMILDKGSDTAAGRSLMDAIVRSGIKNAWFSGLNVRHRLLGIARNLEAPSLKNWAASYEIPEQFTGKTVYVIAAGNIPAAGFEDFMHTILCGHDFLGKLSTDDDVLLPAIAELLAEINPDIKQRIKFSSEKLQHADAVIATGSNNSSRYFEYYFAKYPHVIRKNRNSVAILGGNESFQQLKGLGEDVFRYYGLGCRNVTKLFVPEGYNFNSFFEAIFSYSDEAMMNRKYMNNYEYNRTVFMLNSEPLLDNNFLLLKQDIGLSSPPGVLYYEYYSDLNDVKKRISAERELIQCVVSETEGEYFVAFGEAQNPTINEYADGFDTMKFLLKI